MLSNRDIVLDFTIILLLGFGLLTLFSVSEYYFSQQLLFVIVGLIGYFVISQLDRQFIDLILPILYVFTLGSLVFLVFWGEATRGSASWINLGFVNLQPSEIAKFVILYSIAGVLSRHQEVLKKSLVALGLTIPILTLIFLQPDFGNAFIIFIAALSIFFIQFFNPKLLIISVLGLVISSTILFGFLKPYQKERITSFLNPSSDPLGANYNVIQSKIAIGSGGLLGKGMGRGTQVRLNYLPESHTDFIFASGSESYGFIYSSTLILVFFFLLYWIFNKYTLGSDSVLIKCYSFGVFGVLFSQVVLNIGMNLGLLPVTGLTLPFISYGGSSLVTFMVILGFLQAGN